MSQGAGSPAPCLSISPSSTCLSLLVSENDKFPIESKKAQREEECPQASHEGRRWREHLILARIALEIGDL